MASRRATVLVVILLSVLGLYFGLPAAQKAYYERGRSQQPAPADEPPLAGQNSIGNLSVARAPDGRWIATFDYFYTGDPKGAVVRVSQAYAVGHDEPGNVISSIDERNARRGAQRISIEVPNPNVREMFRTDRVYAGLSTPNGTPFSSTSVTGTIQWPDPVALVVHEAVIGGRPESIVQQAVALIDSEDRRQLARARTLLQALVEKSPRTDSAYVELARVAMKTNWNPAGLRDAEHLIGSALQVAPDSVNAKILLGYVYAHQGRYKEAEPLFAQAAAANPPNLWLWANWGELLAMQGKKQAAIQKYREAVARPPTRDTYDRARRDAYWHLLRLLDEPRDQDAVEALLKQRAQEYAGAGCLGVEYARFLVLQRADAAAALVALREFPSPQCADGSARAVQGLAHYFSWAQGQEPERSDTLRQARAFEPVSPALFRALASSERGVAVARQLIANGEKLALRDRDDLDALALALRDRDSATARRLLRLGASPLAEVGTEKMPVALLPVLTRDFDSIRVLQRAGVDYTRLRFQGTTALDYARNQRDTQLLQALNPGGDRL